MAVSIRCRFIKTCFVYGPLNEHCLTHVSSPFMVYFRRNISILDRLKVFYNSYSIFFTRRCNEVGMVDCTLRIIHNWGEEVMINKDYHRLISDIIATTAFGSSYEEGIELFRSQSELEEYFVASLTSVFIPGKQYLLTPTNLQLWKLDKKVKNSIKK
ncbi:unnamed protein product [Brassica oleracea]